MVVKNGNSGNNTIQGGANDDLIYGKGGQDWLYGKGGNDLLDGGGGADNLFGGGGNDTLIGGSGNDVMVGGSGGDSFNGGGGRDTIDYSGTATGVNAWLASNQSYDGAAGDSFLDVENVIGSSHNDFLQNSWGGYAYGGDGDDQLWGGSVVQTNITDGGTLRGDDGEDTLKMNYGDTTAWLQRNRGTDVIDTFVEGQDMLFIDLSEFGLGNKFESDELVVSSSATAIGTGPQFIYEDDADRLWFDANGSRGGARVEVAQFVILTLNDNKLELNDFETQL